MKTFNYLDACACMLRCIGNFITCGCMLRCVMAGLAAGVTIAARQPQSEILILGTAESIRNFDSRHGNLNPKF